MERAAGVAELSGDSKEADAPDEGQLKPRQAHDGMPKWIGFSGISQAWGRKASVPSIYLAIIRFDHQTIGMNDRREGPDCWSFRVLNGDIAQTTGANEKTVGRAAEELLETGLLDQYEPGKGSRWSIYRVNRDRLVSLHTYVAPRLRLIHGGIHNADPDDKAFASPTRVYGLWGKKIVLPEPVLLEGQEMRALWETRPDVPTWPDRLEVARILRIEGDEPSPTR